MSMCVSTSLNMTISETSGPIARKFHLKHHWGRGNAAVYFRIDQLKTLVSMVTDYSNKIIIGKIVKTTLRLAPSFFIDFF